MLMKVFEGILIPFVGTTLGAEGESKGKAFILMMILNVALG